MISEGSCDTDDWSNDAENSALTLEITDILLCYYKLYKYFTMLLFLLYLYQINAA